MTKVPATPSATPWAPALWLRLCGRQTPFPSNRSITQGTANGEAASEPAGAQDLAGSRRPAKSLDRSTGLGDVRTKRDTEHLAGCRLSPCSLRACAGPQCHHRPRLPEGPGGLSQPRVETGGIRSAVPGPSPPPPPRPSPSADARRRRADLAPPGGAWWWVSPAWTCTPSGATPAHPPQ